ncbi:MAG: SDR family NAD(P)-dependent oxidoreductase [Candidatus Aenigmatarchaeota archaeon]
MKILKDKVAIVTGAGGGIGKFEAIELAKAGAKIVVNDVGCLRNGTGSDTRMADQVVEEIRKLGGEAVASYDSVATANGATAIIKKAIDSFGRLDILVNNAGILRDRTILKMSEDEWDSVINVHLKGTFLLTQKAAAIMKDQGSGGRIINTTSVSGLIGNFGQANYAAAKAGIYGLTMVASIELKKYGITVNAIAPIALTRMTQDLARYGDADPDEIGPQHIAPVVVYLCSDMASDITGKVIGIKGRKIYSYRMLVTEGVEKKEGIWSIDEIHKVIRDIVS